MAPTTYRVIITAESPLSFSQRKPGGIFQESLEYVPGSALRGAVAGELLAGPMQHHVDEDHDGFVAGCDFCAAFLGPDAAVFTNAYPVSGTGEAPHIVPATAVSCKNHPGFEGESEAHGAFDTLIDRFCWEELKPTGLLYAPNCPECHERVETFRGYYVVDDDGTYRRRQVSQRLLTRVAINRRRGVAEDGLLYSPWVIEDQRRDKTQESGYRPQRFSGWLHTNSDDVRAMLTQLAAVGGRTSRGLNHVRIEVVEANDLESAGDVAGRIEAFNGAIAARWQAMRALGGRDRDVTGTYFTLDLQSDGVFRTRRGRPTMVANAELLRRATQGAFAGSGLELVRSYASYHYAGGWNSAWQRPKPAEVRTNKGSVYLFRVDDTLSSDQYAALATLQSTGIGERTSEGFGQVRVCDGFHVVMRDA